MWRWVGVLAWGLAADAWAVGGLTWQWEEGQTRRWLVKTSVELPEPMDFLSLNNIDTRISKFDLTAVIRCTPAAFLGKRGWELRCEIDDASLTAVALPSHVGRVEPVVQEWVTVLRDKAWIQIVQRPDGRLASVHLEGVERSNDRFQRVAEWMRQMVLRAIAPLDVHLPKTGVIDGDVWPQKSGLAFTAPSFTGGIGSVLWTHRIQPGEGPVYLWIDEGSGTIQPGGENVESSLMTLNLKLSGSARFNVASGTLEECQYYSEGAATSSSAQSEGGRNARYLQTSYILLLAEGVTPALPPSGEVK